MIEKLEFISAEALWSSKDLQGGLAVDSNLVWFMMVNAGVKHKKHASPVFFFGWMTKKLWLVNFVRKLKRQKIAAWLYETNK